MPAIIVDDDTYDKISSWMNIPRGDLIQHEDMVKFVEEHFTLARLFYEARAEVSNNFSRTVDNYQKAQELVGKT